MSEVIGDSERGSNVRAVYSVGSADAHEGNTNDDNAVVADVLEHVVAAVADGAPDASPSNQITVALIDEIVEDNNRKTVELGLQTFNAIPNVCETIVNAIQEETTKYKSSDSVKMYCNPAIGLLSDFTPHYKMLISANVSEPIDPLISTVEATLTAVLNRPMFQEQEDRKFVLRVESAPFMHNYKQISLNLWIGEVFHVPVFTAYVVNNALDNARLDVSPMDEPFLHNAKLIIHYTRVDVLLELLLHSEESDVYAPVNVLIARGIHTLIVSKFAELSPNAAIAAGCQPLFDMIQPPELRSVVAKMALIAIMQNPAVKTVRGEHFSDIFPSGQYGKYFEEVAHRATTVRADQGSIMLNETDPLTRTDIIIAAMTAMNTAMKEKDAHMVISGGAAVSFYIQEFLKNLDSFKDVVAVAVAGAIDMQRLEQDCRNIKMNDIDCIALGDVSRQFLSLFSLYMMILYDNFFARPKRYGVAEKDVPPISFALSASASDRIDMYMYGNRGDDSNTMLISKRLRKDPRVQLVTQKTKCFSQIVHPLCEQQQPIGCKEDDYYLEPIDLVKKTMEHFVNLYMRSLYPKSDANYATEDPETREKIATMLKEEYYRDNLVSLKVIMLDVICIFCDEGASLFCRIFMARKNPKDFARLRVFIDIYLLQLLRSNASFAADKAEFIKDVRQLRDLMAHLNTTYYLEQGTLAAFNADKAVELNARRDEFLGVLRRVGRAIVELDAPTEPVPMQFRTTTGENTIRFCRNSPQIKYNFDMSQHMNQLFGVYAHAEEAGEAEVPRTYDAWLRNVFETILVAPNIEVVFREKLATILKMSMAPDSNYEIDFKDMPVRSPFMIELQNELNGIKINEATLNDMNKFSALRYNLLTPLREFIKKQGGVAPNETYVIKLYDTSTINNYLIALVKYALLKERLQSEDAESGLMKIVNEPAEYDDAVREEIGRILLEWNDHAPPKLGGSTRKRKQCCRLKNAKTHSKMRTGKRRNTRKKHAATKGKRNRTHRA